MYLIIFLAGAFLGQVISAVPQWLFIRGYSEIPKDDFMKAFPQLWLVGFTARAVSFVSAIPIFLVFASLFFGSYQSRGEWIVFFFPAFMIAGLELPIAFYELLAGVTPVIYRGGARFIMNPNARKSAVVRIALFGIVAAATFYFCNLS